VKVYHYCLVQILACRMLEVLMHWVIVDIVVAVLVGTKLNDECVGDPVLI
jgi:hypothetical protein